MLQTNTDFRGIWFPISSNTVTSQRDCPALATGQTEPPGLGSVRVTRISPRDGIRWWVAQCDSVNRWMMIEEAVKRRRNDLEDHFNCPVPGCNHPMTLKGWKPESKRRPHFSHQRGSTCPGGEGARHLRVKLVLHEMLNGIHQHHPLTNLTWKPQLEKQFDRTRPDVVIESLDETLHPSIAIEIVDTHAPEAAVQERWAPNLIPIKISDWPVETMDDVAEIQQRLIPYVLDVRLQLEQMSAQTKETRTALRLWQDTADAAFEAEVQSAQDSLADALNRFKENLQEEHLKQVREVESDHGTLVDERTNLMVWLGENREVPSLNPNRRNEWGVSIESENTAPEPGDWTLIKYKSSLDWAKARLLEETSRRYVKKRDSWIYEFRVEEKQKDFQLTKMMIPQTQG